MNENEKSKIRRHIEDLLAKIEQWDGDDVRELERVCERIIILLQIIGEDQEVEQFVKIEKALGQARTNAGCPLGPEPADGVAVDWSGRVLCWSQIEYRYAADDLNEPTSDDHYHWGSVIGEFLQRLDDDGRRAMIAAAAAPPHSSKRDTGSEMIESVDEDTAEIEEWIARHEASRPPADDTYEIGFEEPPPRLRDEWLFGDSLGEAGERRRYIVHLHHPRFAARITDHDSDGAVLDPGRPTDALSGGAFPINEPRVFSEIEWFGSEPWDQREWLDAAANAFEDYEGRAVDRLSHL